MASWGWVGWMCVKRQEGGGITKEREETFRGNGGGHYFYRGDFSDVTCENRSNYIHLICEAYCILIIHQYVYKRRNLKTLRRETKKERNTSYSR